MAEFQVFQYGGVQYPLIAVDPGTELLSICDPILATLLDFFEYRIGYYLGDVLTSASTGGHAPITSAVETKIAVDPEILSKADQFKFPLLAVWHMRSDLRDQSTNWRERTRRLGISYVLPPLSAAQEIRILPLLSSVEAVIDHSIKQGFDPGFNSGERVFLDTRKAQLMTGSIGRYPFGDTIDFHAWRGEMDLVETMRPTSDGLSEYVGSSITITDESVQEGNPITLVQASIK